MKTTGQTDMNAAAFISASPDSENSLMESILDDSNQMIQVSDLDTMTMLYANRTARVYTGHADQPYRGEHCYKYMMGLDAPCPFCPLNKMNCKDSEETEVDNGHEVYAVKTKLLQLDGRRVFIEYAWDITKIYRSRKIFEDQLNTLLKSIPQAQGVLHLDLTADLCLSTAGIARNMQSFQKHTGVDETILQMAAFIPNVSERSILFNMFSKDALLRLYENGEVQRNHEIQTMFDDGSVRFARISARLMMNPTNEHLECVIYCIDISDEINEKKKYEENIRQQLAIFNTLSKNFLNVFLVNAKKDSARILKLDGYVTTGLSKDSSAIYCYSDICRQYIKERVHPDDRDMMTNALSTETILRMLQNQDDYVGIYRTLTNDGTHHYQFRYDRLGQSDDIIASFQGVDEIIRDEKERQETLALALDAAQQSNRAKTQFLNNMSHDIRTPMNAILGFTALSIQHFDEKERVRDYLNKIDTSGRHLLSLINDVLDMSKIESGGLKLTETEVHLPDIFRDLSAILQPETISRQIKLTFEAGDIVNEDVICDPLRLNQILLNLLSNALKFTNPGGNITVHIHQKSAAEAAAGYAAYEFSVRDTGIGMSEEFQTHIFEAFAREKTSTVSGIQGTGLGMAITKNIVDVMGGTIRVKSRRGEGSEFVVSLQFKINEHLSKAGSLQPQKVIDIDFTGKKILLVEDNLLNQEIAREILEEFGFEVDVADDGDVAVAKVQHMQKGDYDAILMDIQMPKMDGYTATREIRTLRNPDAANLPIIALTANAFEEDKNAAIRVGMNGHIAKPFDINELMGVLAKVLR